MHVCLTIIGAIIAACCTTCSPKYGNSNSNETHRGTWFVVALLLLVLNRTHTVPTVMPRELCKFDVYLSAF